MAWTDGRNACVALAAGNASLMALDAQSANADSEQERIWSDTRTVILVLLALAGGVAGGSDFIYGVCARLRLLRDGDG